MGWTSGVPEITETSGVYDIWDKVQWTFLSGWVFNSYFFSPEIPIFMQIV